MNTVVYLTTGVICLIFIFVLYISMFFKGDFVEELKENEIDEVNSDKETKVDD